jgi:DDE family transposase/transposase IS4-like protein
MLPTIRQIDLQDKGCHHISLELVVEQLPTDLIAETLTACQAWEQRERKLNMLAVVSITLAMGLFPRQSLKHLLRHLASPWRTVTGQAELLCTESAFCHRRSQLPVKVFHQLFRRLARPLATQETPGAFWRGRRLMAIDGTLEDVPDTPANAAAFGRVTHGPSRSPFPQIRCTALIECGTHAVIDASLTPCRVGELSAARRLIRSVQSDMLVLMDRGFRSLQVLQNLTRQGAAILSRLPSDLLRSYEYQLADGSWVAILGKGRNCQDEPLLVRVIEYTLRQPGLPGTDQRHRLMTTLLDPQQAPALELVALYRQRWQAETTFGEIDAHQQIEQRPLRSQRPTGILQELYAILLAHFLVRSLMHQAATLPDQPPLPPSRLSYQQSVSVICTTLHDAAYLCLADRPVLCQRLLSDLRHTLLPQRKKTLRSYPRVVKRVYCKFPPKRSSHLPILRDDLTWQSIFSLFQ